MKNIFFFIIWIAMQLFIGVIAFIIYHFTKIPFGLTVFITALVSAVVMGIFFDLWNKKKQKTEISADLTKRGIPPEYDTEYTELTLKLYKTVYDLQRAEKALTILNVSYIKEQDITDLDKRKMLSVLKDCEEKVADYPSQIELLKQRRREILTDVKTNYPDEVFPFEPIFLDRKYNNIEIDTDYYDNNTWRYK